MSTTEEPLATPPNDEAPAQEPVAEIDSRELRLRVDEFLRRQIRARIARLVDAAEVEDLTQETLLRVMRGLPRFRGDASLTTWALRIAGNVVIDHRRRLRCRPECERVPGNEDLAGLLESRDPGPEDDLEQRISADCLRGALALLSESYRQVFELHDLAGLDLAEIAELLDLPVSTVKIRVHRARRRLRQACEAGCEVYRGRRGEVACGPRDESGANT
jgi:RNA polymerase sigma-70 factor (ECF subfamily)